MGTGVTVTTFTRIRNSYLDAQYRAQSIGAGQACTETSELQQAQSAFDEPSTSGWSQASSRPSGAPGTRSPTRPRSEAAREGVVSKGTQLATTLTSSRPDRDGSKAGHPQYASITGPTGEVQDAANQIAQLNHQISSPDRPGSSPTTSRPPRPAAGQALGDWPP